MIYRQIPFKQPKNSRLDALHRRIPRVFEQSPVGRVLQCFIVLGER